jgi:hypothetical protein
MSLFEKGKQKTGGRAKGVRNRLSQAFLEGFAADFEQHGAEVIKIVRVEKPAEYLKTVAYLMPKEFEITETHLMEIPDAELDQFIDFARRRIAEGARDIGGREDQTTPEMLDLPFRDQVLEGAGDVLDRHVRIDAVLVEEVDQVDLEPLQRRNEGPPARTASGQKRTWRRSNPMR